MPHPCNSRYSESLTILDPQLIEVTAERVRGIWKVLPRVRRCELLIAEWGSDTPKHVKPGWRNVDCVARSQSIAYHPIISDEDSDGRHRVRARTGCYFGLGIVMPHPDPPPERGGNVSIVTVATGGIFFATSLLIAPTMLPKTLMGGFPLRQGAV